MTVVDDIISDLILLASADDYRLVLYNKTSIHLSTNIKLSLC